MVGGVLAAGLLLAVAAVSTAAEHEVVRTGRGAVVEMRTAALLMSGQQGGKLPIAISALPSADGVRATVMVEIDGASLILARPASGPLTVEIFVYVLGRDLEVLDQSSLAIDLDPDLHGEMLAGTGLKAFVPLSAPAGGRLLRVLARSSDSFGLRGLEVTAPDEAGAGEARIQPPLFYEADEPWLLVAPAGEEIALPAPFGLGGGLSLPTTRPILVPGESISGHLLLDAGRPEPWLLEAHVRAPGGDVVTAEIEIVELGAPGVSGLRPAAVSLVAPELIPGAYEMAIALAREGAAREGAAREGGGASEKASRSAFVPIFVDASSSPIVREAVAREQGDAPPRSSLGREEKNLARAVQTEYLSALRQLAAGERRAALTTLAASEVRAVDQLDAEAVAVLARGEGRVLADLGQADWQGVLPVILLHLDLSREYRRSGRFILAHHATQMVLTLAGAYADELGTPEARIDAARAVSSLAGYLQHRGVRSQSKKLFDEARALAADEEAALLGLATLLEKRGRFPEALAKLEDFVASRPGDREGRLRLAVNLYRTGRMDAARLALDELTAGSGTDWVAVLAHQELARIEMDEGRWNESAGVLRRGIERWPGHPTLMIQLAYVLDARGEARASRELLEDLGADAAAPEASERSRYNRWPDEVLREMRQTLEEDARGRLEILKSWLAAVPEMDAG